MQLNAKAFGLAGGILWSLTMFVLTWLALMGYGSMEASNIAKSYYIGYSVSPIGSIIGAIYGFFDAGIGCSLFALLYNKLAGK